MSIFSKIGRFVKKAIPKEIKQVAPALLGLINPMAGAVAGVLSGGSQAQTASLPPPVNGFMSSSPKMLPWMGGSMGMAQLPAVVAGAGTAVARVLPGAGAAEIGRASCRERVSVRV